jgi:hypothetical protein
VFVRFQVFVQAEGVDLVAAMEGGDALLVEQAFEQRKAQRQATMAVGGASRAGV